MLNEPESTADEGRSAGEDSDLTVEQRKSQTRRRLIEHRWFGSHDHQSQLFVSHVSSQWEVNDSLIPFLLRAAFDQDLQFVDCPPNVQCFCDFKETRHR